MASRRACCAALLAAALPARAAQPAPVLTVAAAASLADAMRELVRAFEAARPGVAVRLTSGASGVLLQQIGQGAPVDVLAAADRATIEQGIARGWLDAATRRSFASNRLVLIVPADAAAPPASIAELPRARRIAIGAPATVPAGRYAMQALHDAGLQAPLTPRLVPAQNVRQVLDYVARGEVDAGFVYRSDAATMPRGVRVVQQLPAPLPYDAAVVRGSARAALAAAFVEHLAAPASLAVLQRHGFAAP